MEYELYHHGILGMHWGIRRYQNKDGTLTSAGKKRYASTSIRGAIARYENEKIRKSFDKWKEQTALKEKAVNAGKAYNEAKNSGQTDKDTLKSMKKDYKKSLRKVTTYRKGQVRGEVLSDAARAHMTQANRVYKQMQADPNNRELAKEYQRLMNLHDKELAASRRAPKVAANRSRRIAAIKGGLTKTAKAAAATAAVGAGLYFTNQYLNSKGKGINLNSQEVLQYIKKAKDIFKYIY